jgi:hypothetical protein
LRRCERFVFFNQENAMRFKVIFGLLSVLLGLCGCSTQTAYLSAQEMQRAQCDRLPDLQEMQRCRAQARQSYDDYQRQADAARPAP